ncbi:MAG: glycosyltransferase family 39 protein [Candidatus Omnitrophota bacterium]
MKIPSRRQDIGKRIIFYLPLMVACCFSFILTVPVIRNNVNDPNMIVYFCADEGDQMDLIWSYYSGEKRDSYQWDYDYGMERMYLADFARLVLSHFMVMTPGAFVLIMRWLYLLAWVASIFALWRLVSYHFGRGWQPALAILLLAVRPAFVYLSNNLKPEPLVLLFMIIGLDYTMRIVEDPFKRRNLVIAIACASVAFMIKFAGLFLLPAIIGSMYLSQYCSNTNKRIFPEIKISWVFEAIVGVVLILLLFLSLFFYVRASTGYTFYGEAGLWGSMLKNKLFLFLFLAGLFLILLSAILWALNKSKNVLLHKVIDKVNKVNSYALIVCGIFLGFILLPGLKWIFNPKLFIVTYSEYGSVFLGGEATTTLPIKHLIYAYAQNLFSKIAALDWIIVILFGLYLLMECRFRRQNWKNNAALLSKRLVLLIYLIPFFFAMLSAGYLAQHHMLPFFIAFSILALQGVSIFSLTSKAKSLSKTIVISAIGLLLIIDILVNAANIAKSRSYEFHQKEDVVFELADWWRKNIPLNARVVADWHIRIYIPQEYTGIKTFKGDGQARIEQFRRLVSSYHPEFIYYNAAPSGNPTMPPIEEILPNNKTQLIKSFDNSGRRYVRRAGDKFLVYKVTY